MLFHSLWIKIYTYQEVIYITLGKKLKNLREKSKKKQYEVCEKLNINQTTYSNYELDVREPDNDTLKKIAQYFKVSIDYLLDNDIENIKTINNELKNIIQELENDKELNAKVQSITELDPEERKKIYKILDAVIDEDK